MKKINNCDCIVCKLKEEKFRIMELLNNVELLLKKISNDLYFEDHYMDNEF